MTTVVLNMKTITVYIVYQTKRVQLNMLFTKVFTLLISKVFVINFVEIFRQRKTMSNSLTITIGFGLFR